MATQKRYVLVEVDVEAYDVCGETKLTAEGENFLWSVQGAVERLSSMGYGNQVYGTTLLADSDTMQSNPKAFARALEVLHRQACNKVIGALGKECDNPKYHV